MGICFDLEGYSETYKSRVFLFIMEGEFIRHKGEIVNRVKAPMYK